MKPGEDPRPDQNPKDDPRTPKFPDPPEPSKPFPAPGGAGTGTKDDPVGGGKKG